MRNALLLVCALISVNVWGDMVEVLCPACRSPDQHPKDFGNHAYNQVLGQDGWMTLGQADKMLITNLNNRWAVVDVDIVLIPLQTSIRFPFLSFDIMVPTQEIAITVYTDTGEVERYRMMISGRDLIVGPPPAPATPVPGSTGTSSGGRSGSSTGSSSIPVSSRVPNRFHSSGGGVITICRADARGDCENP